MIGLMHEAEALDEGLGAVADGVQALQIKGGVDLARDVRLVAALRRELGPDITLRLVPTRVTAKGRRKPCCAWPSRRQLGGTTHHWPAVHGGCHGGGAAADHCR
jgi:hypothetical protein